MGQRPTLSAVLSVIALSVAVPSVVIAGCGGKDERAAAPPEPTDFGVDSREVAPRDTNKPDTVEAGDSDAAAADTEDTVAEDTFVEDTVDTTVEDTVDTAVEDTFIEDTADTFDEADVDSGPTGAPFGASCMEANDCLSRICQKIAGDSTGRCSKKCTLVDCPTSWACVAATGGGKVCSCSSTGAETCDGKDNDCDGVVDEDVTCEGALLCDRGACRCPDARSCPDGVGGTTCADLRADGFNCGVCGNVCGGTTSECVAGVCPCTLDAGSGISCFGECVDPRSNDLHCGSCSPCVGGKKCVAGKCV